MRAAQRDGRRRRIVHMPNGSERLGVGRRAEENARALSRRAVRLYCRSEATRRRRTRPRGETDPARRCARTQHRGRGRLRCIKIARRVPFGDRQIQRHRNLAGGRGHRIAHTSLIAAGDPHRRRRRTQGAPRFRRHAGRAGSASLRRSVRRIRSPRRSRPGSDRAAANRQVPPTRPAESHAAQAFHAPAPNLHRLRANRQRPSRHT